MTRRDLLAGAAGAGIAVGTEQLLGSSGHSEPQTRSGASRVPVAFRGEHQAGIGTPAQNYLYFAAFDVTSQARTDLVGLLREWTHSAVALTQGDPIPGKQEPGLPPIDPDEAAELGPAHLTLTFGFGPTLFERDGRARFGLRGSKPPLLRELPSFPRDALDVHASGGDICIQACADDPQVAFHAIHALAHQARSVTSLRWTQLGFGRTSSTGGAQRTPRNLMGFKDGTANIRSGEDEAMQRFVWVQHDDTPVWLAGGTYLMARRIRILFDVWDAATLEEQQQAVGREKRSGAPLGQRKEYDPIDLTATVGGQPVIPLDAHVRVAHPASNDGQRILRRGYSYSEPVEPSSGQIDAGLFFISFQRDPGVQTVPLLRRLASSDALSRHTLHTSSSLFACPSGIRRGEFIGEALF